MRGAIFVENEDRKPSGGQNVKLEFEAAEFEPRANREAARTKRQVGRQTSRSAGSRT